MQKYSDGFGLYLHVTEIGNKLWRMAYRFDGKQKLLSFGAYPAISLKDARNLRDNAKELLAKNVDPSVHKQEKEAATALITKQKQETFKLIALEWFAKYAPTLTPKHVEKLTGYFNNKLFPVIGHIPIIDIEPQHLLNAVRPAELMGHNETAHKLLSLCHQVIRYAKITGRVKYIVSADLSSALQPVKVKHQASITNPKEIGILLRDIDNYQGHFSIIYCLKILPYVFTRPSELRLAQWSEIDFDNKIWRIPAKCMKMRKEHTVPLSRQVCNMFKELHIYSGTGNFIFPSTRAKTQVISDVAPLAALRRMGYAKEDMCLHGFRAMASTCLNEQGFRYDVIEAQLAHQEQNAVRLAYNRAQYLEERRQLMQAWADYLDELRRGK